MSTLKVGDSFPEGVVFSYIPYTPETSDITACGIPINYDASKGTSFFHQAPPYLSLNAFIPVPHRLSLTHPVPLLYPNKQQLTARSEWANKKVVLFAVP